MGVLFMCAAEQRFRGDEEKMVHDLTLAVTPKDAAWQPVGTGVRLSTFPAIDLGKEILSFCHSGGNDVERAILNFRRAGFAA
jgi:hypothetical protein